MREYKRNKNMKINVVVERKINGECNKFESRDGSSNSITTTDEKTVNGE